MIRNWFVIGFVLFLSLPCANGAAQPKELEAAILRIQDLIAGGSADAALLQVSEALAKWPRSGGLYNLRGIVRAEARESAEAERDFEAAVRWSPGLLPAWKNLGQLYEDRIAGDAGAWSKAEAAYRRGLRIAPADDALKMSVARLEIWKGLFAPALRDLEGVSETGEKGAPYAALHCAALAGTGHAAAAKAEALRLAQSGDLDEGLVLSVLPALEKQNPESARILVEALQSQHRATSASTDHLGSIYERLGELAKAREAYETLAQEHTGKAGPLMDLARVAYQQHDFDGALGYAAHAREIEPENAAVHFFFGMVAVEKNLPVEARRSLEKAVALAPDQPTYNYALGGVILQGSEAAQAVPYFRKYLKLTHDAPRGRFALGVALFSSGDFVGAQQELEKLVHVPETAAGAHYFLARIDKVNGNFDAAAEHLRASIHDNPDYAEAHAELAGVRLNQSDFEGARRALDAALKLDPDNALANRNLLALYQRTKNPKAPAQADRVRKLEAARDERKNLLFRNIELRPY